MLYSHQTENRLSLEVSAPISVTAPAVGADSVSAARPPEPACASLMSDLELSVGLHPCSTMTAVSVMYVFNMDMVVSKRAEAQ